MKILSILFVLLLTASLTLATVPDGMPESTYNQIIQQVIDDKGYLDMSAVQESIAQWQLQQPLPATDGQLVETGSCTNCAANTQGTKAKFKKPRKVKVQAKKHANGTYPSVLKIRWLKPKKLKPSLRSLYKVSHYLIYISKDGQSYEVLRKKARYFKSGRLKKHQRIKFKDRTTGSYAVQVQAVYKLKSATNKSAKKSLDKAGAAGSFSPWSPKNSFVTEKKYTTVGQYTGAIHSCLNANGFVDSTLLTAVDPSIDCTNYNLQNADIKLIANLVNIRSIIIADNPAVTDISILSNLNYLEYLDLSNNSNIALPGFSLFSELTTLKLANMGLTTVPDLSTNDLLTTLILNDNAIVSGFELLPNKLDVLDTKGTSANPCDTIPPSKIIDSLTLSGPNITSIESCGNVSGLRYLTVNEVPNLELINSGIGNGNSKVSVSIDNFAGFCGLSFLNTNIEILEGSRPINRLNLINNTALQQVNTIKLALNGTTTIYPDLIPASIRIQGSDSMDCSVMYQKKTLIETLPSLKMKGVSIFTKINGIEKNSLACPLTKPADYRILPTQCKPDPILAFNGYVSEGNNTLLTWQPHSDVAIWGVTYYEIKKYTNGELTKSYSVDLNAGNSLSIKSRVDNFATVEYKIKACTASQCGYETTINAAGFFAGINRVTALVDYEPTTPLQNFTINIKYKYPTNIAPESTPTRFEISSLMGSYSEVIDCQAGCVSSTFYPSSLISYNANMSSELQVKACNDVLGCGPSASVDIRPVVTSAEMPVPIWRNSSVTGNDLIIDFITQQSYYSISPGPYNLDWKLPSGNQNNANVDYFEIIEWQPVDLVDSGFSQRLKTTYYVDILNDRPSATNGVFNYKLTRKVKGAYDYNIRACKRYKQADQNDVCSEYAGGIIQVPNPSNPSELLNCYDKFNGSTTCYSPQSNKLYLQAADFLYDPAFDAPSDIGSNSSIGWNNASGLFNIQWQGYQDTQADYFLVKQMNATEYPNNCEFDNGSSNAIIKINFADINNANSTWTTETYCPDLGVNTIWKVKACTNGLSCSAAVIIDLGDGTGGTNSILNPTNPNVPQSAGGPGEFKPGGWWNPELSGTGWHFYWASELRFHSEHNNPANDELYGNTYDLIGYWLSYKQTTKVDNGNITSAWTPTWYEVRLKSLDSGAPPDINGNIISGCFEGTINYKSLTHTQTAPVKHEKTNVGNLQVCFHEGTNTTATLLMAISDDNGIISQAGGTSNLGPYQLSGDGRLILEIEDFTIDVIGDPNTPPVNAIQNKNNSDHYSGLWQHYVPDSLNKDYADVSVLTWQESSLELSSLALYDNNGEPIWFQAVNCRGNNNCNSYNEGYFDSYKTGDSPSGIQNLSLLSIAYGFNPLQQRPIDFDFAGPIENGGSRFYGTMGRCFNKDAENQNTTNNLRFKQGKVWYKMYESLYSGTTLSSRLVASSPLAVSPSDCSNMSGIEITKQANLSDIRYFINDHNEDTHSCDPNTENTCNIKFTYYTDDFFPSIKPYYSIDNGTSYHLLSDICSNVPTAEFVVPELFCDFTDKPGIYKFQLRKDNYDPTEMAVVIAESKELEIVNCQSCRPTIETVSDAIEESINETVANQPGAGPIPGSGGVSGGAASYNLPLVVPPGRNGMTPSLSINYSSKGGNGILGVGWSLAVGSSIYRCPQTIAQDGFSLPVRLVDSTDRLCWDGQRLMDINAPAPNNDTDLSLINDPINLSYWSMNAEYRTEQDSFAKVTKVNSNEFLVQTKSGRTNTYIKQGLQKTSWQLIREEDTFGNNINYEYSVNGINEILLSAIYYTGFATLNGSRIVKLNYVDRIDFNTSYLAGQRTDSSKILNTIQTFTPDSTTAKRTYKFDYLPSVATGRTVLQKIEEKIGNELSTISRVLLENSWSQDIAQEDGGWTSHAPETKLERINAEDLGIIAPDYRDDWFSKPGIFKNGLLKLNQSSDITGNGIRDLSISGRHYIPDPNDPTTGEYEAFSYTVSMNSEGDPEKIWKGKLGSDFTYDFDKDGRMDYSFFKKTAEGEYTLVITKWLNSGEQDNISCPVPAQGFTPLCNRLSYIETGFKLNYKLHGLHYKFYDDDNDGDLDLFVTDNINYAIPGAQCPAPNPENHECDKIIKYENTSNNPNSILLSSAPFPYGFLERVTYEGYSFNLHETIRYPLFYQTFVGFKDINGDGVAEIIVENSMLINAANTPEINYLSKDSRGVYRRVLVNETGKNYHKFIDVNKDGLEDLLVIDKRASNNGDNRSWAVRLNTGGSMFTTINGNEVFNESLFSNPILSLSSDFLSNTNGLDYGYPSSAGCAGCTPHPFRSFSNRQIDINADGTDEILIPDTGKLYWNSCRAHVLGLACSGPDCHPTKIAGTTDQIFKPVNFDQAKFRIDELIECRNDPNLPQCEAPVAPNSGEATSGANGVIFICSDDEQMLPGAITVDDDIIGGNFYTETFGNAGSVSAPYAGQTDHSIYGFKALEFTLEKDLSGELKLVVQSVDTTMLADVNGGLTGDINNDGIQDFYSSLGCEWRGCLSSGYNPLNDPNNPDTTNPLLDTTSNNTYDSNLDSNSVFYDYINQNKGHYTQSNKNTAFKRDIKEQSSYAINKITSVMPDMLISAEKPDNNDITQWVYHPLSVSSIDGREGFPLYKVNERNCTSAEFIENEEACNSYVDEDALAGDHFYFNSSMYVVSQMRQTNNYGNDAVTQYAYEEAVYNNKGRGFQGFRKISVRSRPDDSDEGLLYETVSESTFHQVFPYAGKLEKIEVYQQGAKTQQENYTYAPTNLSNNQANGISYYPLISKISQNIELKNGYLATASSTALTNDNYGNITAQTNTIETYDATNASVTLTRSETVQTTNEYNVADTNNWWVDQLAKTTVTKSATNNTPHRSFSEFYWKANTKRELDCQFTYIGNENIAPEPPRSCSTTITNNNISKNTFNYDTNGNITKVTTTATNSSNTAIDRTVDTIYSTDGYFPESITKDINGANLTTSFTYDPATGQVTQTIAPDGNYVDSFYDAYGFKKRDEAKFWNPEGNTIPIAYTSLRNCNGSCPEQSIVNTISGNILTGMIAGSPQLSYYTEQRQNGQPQVITWYDNANNPVLTKTYHSDNTNLDKYNYVVSITTPAGGTITTQPFIQTSSAYPTVSQVDPQGRVKQKRIKIGDLSNNSIGNCTLITDYDHQGGFTQIDVTRDQCSSTSTDIDSLSMSRTYDATGKLSSTKDDQNNEVNYEYDASGNPKELKDADNNTIYTNFDALGRKQSVNDPNMGTKTFHYNGFGEVVQQQVTGESYSTYYTYDKLGRITDQYSNVDTSLAPVDNDIRSYHDTYVYNDNIGGLLTDVSRESNKFQLDVNQPLHGFNEVFHKTLEYDNQNRLLSEKTTLPAGLTPNSSQPVLNHSVDYITQYKYDSGYNRLKQVIYDGSYSVQNLYTRHGTLKQQNQVEAPSVLSTLMQITTWNEKGQETNRQFNNNSLFNSSTQYYPSTGQVAKITHGSTSDDEILDYQYDSWGNIAQQELTRGTTQATEIFGYDSLHRLLSARVNAGTAKTYTYNGIGNIMLKSDYSNAYTYGLGNAGPNAVSRAVLIDGKGTINYTYDNKGNRISDSINGTATATYQYDYNNLLVESTSTISGVQQFINFSYGADNQRYRKQDWKNSEITLYANKDYEEIYKAGSLYPTQKKYYLTSYLTVTKDITGAHSTFMQKDRLGSTTQILDEAGVVLHTKSYDAFGKPRNGDWSDMTGGLFKAKLAFDAPLLDINGEIQYHTNGDIILDEMAIDLSKRGFTDHEHLDEMQLIHMNGRMYDYNNGRFLSVDPFIQSPTSTQSMNPYTYIFNNPLSGVDPSGYIGLGFGGRPWEDQGPLRYGPNCPFCVSKDAGKENDDGSADKKNKNGDISDTGKQEGIFDGVIKPAAKNLGNDFVLGLSQIGDGFNRHILAPPLLFAGKVGDIADDMQGVSNTLLSMGAPGAEVDAAFLLSIKGLKGLGKLGNFIINLGKTKSSVKFIQQTRIEVKALQVQGYGLSEAFQQVRSFNAGNADGFFFHFTNPGGGLGILKSSVINASSTGLRGSGVYAGTTPVPSWFLKNSFAPGWGISGRNVRIPFKTNQQSKPFVYTFKTKVFPKSVDL